MYPASIKPDQPSLDRRRRPGELSIPARYASIQRLPTGIRAVSDPQLVGHRLAMELFENPRGVTLGRPSRSPYLSRTPMRKLLIQKKYRPMCEHVAFHSLSTRWAICLHLPLLPFSTAYRRHSRLAG